MPEAAWRERVPYVGEMRGRAETRSVKRPSSTRRRPIRIRLPLRFPIGRGSCSTGLRSRFFLAGQTPAYLADTAGIVAEPYQFRSFLLGCRGSSLAGASLGAFSISRISSARDSPAPVIGTGTLFALAIPLGDSSLIDERHLSRSF